MRFFSAPRIFPTPTLVFQFLVGPNRLDNLKLKLLNGISYTSGTCPMPTIDKRSPCVLKEKIAFPAYFLVST